MADKKLYVPWLPPLHYEKTATLVPKRGAQRAYLTHLGFQAGHDLGGGVPFCACDEGVHGSQSGPTKQRTYRRSLTLASNRDFRCRTGIHNPHSRIRIVGNGYGQWVWAPQRMESLYTCILKLVHSEPTHQARKTRMRAKSIPVASHSNRALDRKAPSWPGRFSEVLMIDARRLGKQSLDPRSRAIKGAHGRHLELPRWFLLGLAMFFSLERCLSWNPTWNCIEIRDWVRHPTIKVETFKA